MISLCCPKFKTHCPVAEKLNDEICITIPISDLKDYVETLSNGGIKIKFHQEQVKLLLGLCVWET